MYDQIGKRTRLGLILMKSDISKLALFAGLARQTNTQIQMQIQNTNSAHRSRSAERLRGGLRPGAPVIQVAPTGQRSR